MIPKTTFSDLDSQLTLPHRFKNRSIKYVRGGHILEELSPSIFGNYGVNVNDIIQGQLNNCSFLSALVSLARIPSRIERLFQNSMRTPKGEYNVTSDLFGSFHSIFKVNLCVAGQWEQIRINDCIPVENQSDGNNVNILSNVKGSSLWVILLEKAAASLNKQGYSSLEMWTLREAFYVLTGAPCDYYLVSEISDSELKCIVAQALERNYCITCGSVVSLEDNKNMSHAFAIDSIDDCANILTLIDPREQHQEQYSNKVYDVKMSKDSFGIRKVQLNLAEMRKCFQDLCICKVDDRFINDTLESSLNSNAYGFFRITVKERGLYIFSVFQRDFQEQQAQVTWLLGKVNLDTNCGETNESFIFIDGLQETNRQSYSKGIENTIIEAGTYVLAVKIKVEVVTVIRVIIAIYGESSVRIERMNYSVNNYNFIEQLARNHSQYVNSQIQKKMLNYQENGIETSLLFSVSIAQMTEGYIYIAVGVLNSNSDSVKSNKTVNCYFKVNNPKGVKIKKKIKLKIGTEMNDSDNLEVRFQLKEGQNDIAIFRIKDASLLDSFDLHQQFFIS